MKRVVLSRGPSTACHAEGASGTLRFTADTSALVPHFRVNANALHESLAAQLPAFVAGKEACNRSEQEPRF